MAHAGRHTAHLSIKYEKVYTFSTLAVNRHERTQKSVRLKLKRTRDKLLNNFVQKYWLTCSKMSKLKINSFARVKLTRANKHKCFYSSQFGKSKRSAYYTPSFSIRERRNLFPAITPAYTVLIQLWIRRKKSTKNQQSYKNQLKMTTSCQSQIIQ